MTIILTITTIITATIAMTTIITIAIKYISNKPSTNKHTINGYYLFSNDWYTYSKWNIFTNKYHSNN